MYYPLEPLLVVATQPAAHYRLPGEAADQGLDADIGEGGHGRTRVPVGVLT